MEISITTYNSKPIYFTRGVGEAKRNYSIQNNQYKSLVLNIK